MSVDADFVESLLLSAFDDNSLDVVQKFGSPTVLIVDCLTELI